MRITRILVALSFSVPVAAAVLPALPSRAVGPTFTTPLSITNEFFPFHAGAMKVYRGVDGGQRTAAIEVYEGTTRTFNIPGAGTVETRLLREVEFSGGEISEISFNYFAQADDSTSPSSPL